MKGIYIDNSAEMCTRPGELFLLMGDKVTGYNWLINDITGWDFIFDKNKDIVKITDKGVYVEGENLLKIMRENRLATANWAVFSAFPKDTSEGEIYKYSSPYSDRNSRLWLNPITAQHPLAKIEVVISEITDVAVKAFDEDLIRDLASVIRNCTDLEVHNESFIPDREETVISEGERTAKKGFWSRLFGGAKQE